jgi:Peptidase family S41
LIGYLSPGTRKSRGKELSRLLYFRVYWSQGANSIGDEGDFWFSEKAEQTISLFDESTKWRKSSPFTNSVMRVLLLYFGILFFIPTLLNAQHKTFNPNKKYAVDSLQRWTKSVMGGISEKHPGFYRYTNKADFDKLIDSTVLSIQDSLTELDFYRKLKPMFAKIGCLHTGIVLSNEYENYLNQSSTLIPLEVFIDQEKKVLLTKCYAPNHDLPLGAEILKINGKTIEAILNTLLQAIPSDGYNLTEKILMLNHRFPFWYQSIIELSEDFELEFLVNGEVQKHKLKGVTNEVLPTMESLEKNYEKPLEFSVVDGLAILKIHTFAKSEIKEDQQNFKKFVKAVFAKIEKEQVKNLVLDLRYNTGGTDGNAAFLAAYFFEQEFRYWDKIEVTQSVAEEIKGLNRIFYSKPKAIDGTYHWQKTWLTKEFDYYEPQKPAKNNFKGTTYLITNGLCMSSCADFVAVLSHNNKAIVVGQETGGGFQGNTSGMMPEATIPTGLEVTIPLQKYTNAVDLSKNFGQGTKPDHEITPTFEDWTNKRDTEMQYTLKLIKSKRE